ncbi:helix-turn-helix domain-containing protein [Peribacillus frigoritolerans]|uniref:helix-turn-helix domain-containing protein n=1 Tax=Peribacillus frigoritolerans TaxID=450367 RepID=UPI00315CA5A4
MDSYSFFPTQPEMKCKSIYYKESKPQEDLDNEVSLFYKFKVDYDHQGYLPVVPDGCFDLLFCFNESNPFAVVGVSPDKRCTYKFKEDSEYFGVRFYPQQSRVQFNCSFKELFQHEQLPLFDVLNLKESIIEELVTLKGFSEQVLWFSSYLKTINPKKSYDLGLTSYCLKKIYSSYGSININQLSLETGYSDTYIRRKFEDYIGFSPKKFSQIIKLQYSINKLLQNPRLKDRTVEELGYFDRSHFYKNFIKYMSLTPKQYREMIF